MPGCASVQLSAGQVFSMMRAPLRSVILALAGHRLTGANVRVLKLPGGYHVPPPPPVGKPPGVFQVPSPPEFGESPLSLHSSNVPDLTPPVAGSLMLQVAPLNGLQKYPCLLSDIRPDKVPGVLQRQSHLTI
jgi:hypothetical protein